MSPSTASSIRLLVTTFSLDFAISNDESEQIFLIFGTLDTHDDERFKLISTNTNFTLTAYISNKQQQAYNGLPLIHQQAKSRAAKAQLL